MSAAFFDIAMLVLGISVALMAKHLLDDMDEWCEENLHIITKKAKKVRLKSNLAQRLLLEKMKAGYDPARSTKVIVLKARQVGISTKIQALGFERTWRNKFTSSLVVAHDLQSAQNLFRMGRNYWVFMGGKNVRKANVDKQRLEYEADHGSRIVVDTANNQQAASSFTFQFLHLSEMSKWERPEDTYISIMSAFVDEPGSFAFIESSPYGFGNKFQKLWMEAEKGENEYIPFFVPWWFDPEYRLSDIGIENLDADEEAIMSSFPNEFDEEEKVARLAWRRKKIRDLGDVNAFRREFPSNSVEGFISTGRPVFDPQIINQMFQRAEPVSPIVYDIVGDGLFSRNLRGCYREYAEPYGNRRYVIGADPSEGLERGDPAAAIVMDRDSMEVVGVYQAKSDADVFARHLCYLARRFKGAHIACENNTYGVHVNRVLVETLHYNNVHISQVMYSLTQKHENKWGFSTNKKSRNDMIGAAVAAVREERVKILDSPLLREMSVFQHDPKGKAKAPKGETDDLVMAFCICNYVCECIPSYKTNPQMPFKYDPITGEILADGGRQNGLFAREKSTEFEDIYNVYA